MAAPKQFRFVFREYAGAEPAHSLWAQFVPVGTGGTLTMLCDYGADFQPQPGWLAEGRPGRLIVRRVDGRTLTCDAEGGGS